MSKDETALVVIEDCHVGDPWSPAIASVSWRLGRGEAWIVTGPSGGGRDSLAAALGGLLRVAPNEGGSYRNWLAGRTAMVSFEEAAALLRRERYEDDSDFTDGGVSEGTSVRAFLAKALPADETPGYPGGNGLEANEYVVTCDVSGTLDRGLKRLSTGEWRRALLCRALISRPDLLVVVEPYEGLDARTRAAFASILDALAEATVSGGVADGNEASSPILVVVDRPERAPAASNRVVELAGARISFEGSRLEYEARRLEYEARTARDESLAVQENDRVRPDAAGFDAIRELTVRSSRLGGTAVGHGEEALVELRNVTVGWSGRKVLDSLSWTVRRGEHWLVRGPNGSGKTTLLELISGDNPQAYREDVSLFGRRRGTGESVWELKERIGLVSYRLHLEYRYLDGIPLEDVLVSGFHDSIGLYVEPPDSERAIAASWVSIAGFAGRGHARFGSLSFGEQRALLVARAAIKVPGLLILDEPCHGLDDDQRRFVLGLMSGIAARGESTIIHVTHDPDEVMSFERRVLELRPGSNPSWRVIAPVLEGV